MAWLILRQSWSFGIVNYPLKKYEESCCSIEVTQEKWSTSSMENSMVAKWNAMGQVHMLEKTKNKLAYSSVVIVWVTMLFRR